MARTYVRDSIELWLNPVACCYLRNFTRVPEPDSNRDFLSLTTVKPLYRLGTSQAPPTSVTKGSNATKRALETQKPDSRPR